MSSTVSTVSDPRFETRVDLSFIFAKISCVTDDAPHSTYEDSCAALFSVTELLSILVGLIKKDIFLLGALSEYLAPRLNKIVAKIFIKSFLDNCITEMWNQGLQAEIFVTFVTFFKTIAIIGNALDLELSKTCKKKDENGILLITDSNKIEIIDKLFVVSAQHPDLYRSKFLPEFTSLTNYEAAKVRNSVNLFEMCIETVLIEDISPSVEIVRYLTEKYLAANSFRREVKLFLLREYIKEWQHRLMESDSHRRSTVEANQLVELRNRIVFNDEENLTVELCLLARSINKLILRFKYLNGELKNELPQHTTLESIVKTSNVLEQSKIENHSPDSIGEPVEEGSAPQVSCKPKDENSALGDNDTPNVKESPSTLTQKSTAPSKKSLFKYLRKRKATANQIKLLILL